MELEAAAPVGGRPDRPVEGEALARLIERLADDVGAPAVGDYQDPDTFFNLHMALRIDQMVKGLR